MLDIAKAQSMIGVWAEHTFNHTPDGIIKHLRREVAELDEHRNEEEAADCVILLFTLAHHCGWDLESAIAAKHSVNLKRKWGTPDAEGVTEHVRIGS